MPPSCSTAWPNGWSGRDTTSVADLRGLLAVPAPTDQADYERASYVRALHAANVAHGPW